MEDKRQGDKMRQPVRQAVALKYAGDAQQAPQVVAAGKGDLAERIIAAATEAGVPVQTNAALAQALCRLEVGREIPSELYQAVAEVLAFILLADQKARQQR